MIELTGIGIEVKPRFDAFEMRDFRIRNLTPDAAALASSPAYLKFLQNAGPGWTLYLDGEPLVAVVLNRMRYYTHTAEVACLVSERCDNRILRIVHRICLKSLDEVQQNEQLWRLEARIAECAKIERRWAEKLGFQTECPVRYFGPSGETFIQYARLRGPE